MSGTKSSSTGKSKKGKHQDLERLQRLPSSELDREYRKKGEEAWEAGWNMLMDMEGWKVEHSSTDTNPCVIYSKHMHKIGKVFKLEGVIQASPQFVFEETVLKLNESVHWNPSLVDCRTLRVIDDCTDISYNATSSAAGGLVSSRDFVNLRHWNSRDGIILSAGCAVVSPDMPPNKTHVRGENKAGGWVFRPVDGNTEQCIFNWIINTDLKGWIPQYLVDQAMTGMLTEFIKALRDHVDSVKINGNTK